MNAQNKDLALSDTRATSSSMHIDEEVITIYPNPASSFIEISNSSKTAIVISVYNILGDIVLSNTVAEGLKTIDISNLSSGIYIVAFNDGEEVRTQRLVKT